MATWTVPLIRGAWDGPTLDAWIRQRAARDVDPHRRTLVLGGIAAGAIAVFSGALATVVAVVGRALNNGTAAAAEPGTTSPTPSTSPSPSPSRDHGTSSPSPSTPPPGREITKASAVATGSAFGFRDNNGTPAWLVHETSGDFRAFTAVCTHAGCVVQFNANAGFVCPCHGGEYSAVTGSVVAGPPPAPLTQLRVTVVGDSVRLL
jgi:thiosulfate dehydrogenase (quinone) large subunit